MNKIKFLILLLSLPLFFTGCDQEQDDLVTVNAQEGGLVEPVNPLINYIVNDGATYTAKVKTFQGEIKTTSVEVYKKLNYAIFNEVTIIDTTIVDGVEVVDTITKIVKTDHSTQNLLFKTIPITDTQTSFFTFDFDYNSLIEGLIKEDGTPVSTNDADLNIGDTWVLTYVSTTSEGNKFVNSANTASTSVSVATRLAGVYEVVESTYWRLGVDNGHWNGAERIIKSVNATTYLHEGFGPFEYADFEDAAKFYITVNADNTTDYPAIFEGFKVTGRGDYLITCEANPADMTNAPCDATSNHVVLDNVNGKDMIYMTYGYMIDGSGPREFYEVLRRK